jgi:hypothetical protein
MEFSMVVTAKTYKRGIVELYDLPGVSIDFDAQFD